MAGTSMCLGLLVNWPAGDWERLHGRRLAGTWLVSSCSSVDVTDAGATSGLKPMHRTFPAHPRLSTICESADGGYAVMK
jgi:hypothetical protein